MTWMVFDVETMPAAGIEEFAPDFKPAGNLKDPVKIAADVAEKRAKWLEKAALDPDCCEVSAVGMAFPFDGVCAPKVVNDRGLLTEQDILERFWMYYYKADKVIGFNILAFDLPVLLQRSRYCGVTAPVGLIEGRYRHADRLKDLMVEMTFGRPENAYSLSWYCKRLGIDVEDATTGKDAAAAATEGNWEAVRTHLFADLEKTVALARWLGVI